MKIKFYNAHIITVNDNWDIIKNGVVEVEGNLITHVGDGEKNEDGYFDKVINCEGNILMPGLINAHSHAAMTLFRGLADDVPFEQWWKHHILPREKVLTGGDLTRGLEIAIKEMLSNGITTFFDCYFGQEHTVEAVQRLGIRAGVGFGAVWGSDEVSPELVARKYETLKNKERIFPFLYAHSTYSCDEYQFGVLLGAAKKFGLPFSTHVSETLLEVGECFTKNGVTPIGLLESYGMFDVKCVLAHCVHADKDDVEILKRYDVSVAHNPASNLKLGSGIAPVTSFVKNDINVCLGTDGAASNNALDLFREMYLAANLQFGVLNNPKAIKTAEVIKMATVNGARAFGVENLGVIKTGFLADLILISTAHANMQPLHDSVANVVFSANPKNVLLTMVDGKIVYQANNDICY